MEYVPNDALRVRFLVLHEREGLTLNDVAERLNWRRPGLSPQFDGTRVARSLGLRYAVKHGRRVYQQRVTYECAVAFASVLAMDPIEAGV